MRDIESFAFPGQSVDVKQVAIQLEGGVRIHGWLHPWEGTPALVCTVATSHRIRLHYAGSEAGGGWWGSGWLLVGGGTSLFLFRGVARWCSKGFSPW